MSRFNAHRVLDTLLVLCAVASTVALVARSTGTTPTKVNDGLATFEGWQADLANDRIVGPPEAPYRLLVWTDYQCPACKKFEEEIDRARALLGDSLTVVYRHHPLEGHSLAFDAAVVAECARAQGRFEQMHRALFAETLSGDSLPLQSLVTSAGVQPRAMQGCLADSAAAAVVRRDLRRAKEIGMRGTPGIQIGDRIGTGGRSAENLLPLLRAARRPS